MQLTSRHVKKNLAYHPVPIGELWRISIVKELIHSDLEGFSNEEIIEMKDSISRS